MAIIVNLGSLLRAYASYQKSAFINYHEFCDYVKKYAERHVEEQADLIKYLGNPEPAIQEELKILAEKHQAYIQEAAPGKKSIIVTTFFSDYFAQVYKDISTNPSISFPTLSDLPKQVPSSIIEKENASDLFPKLWENQDLKASTLYCILLPHDASPILFPVCVKISILTDAAIAKIRNYLKKEEYHDYFLKKLRNANQGKEITIQNFYSQVFTKTENSVESVESSSDDFYYWNQLCYFIRQDFEKLKDITQEDSNLLQAVSISEVYMLYLKNKTQVKQVKDDALKELDDALQKAPYFFSMAAILKLTDSHGTVLFGQYSDADLKTFLERMTTESDRSELPRLLVFKTETGTRYFIYKTKVFPLVIRLCNEAHTIIEEDITNEWCKTLLDFEKLPEMHDNKIFNDKLKEEVRKQSPVLYTLLNANFLTMLYYEVQNNTNADDFKLFANGHLLPFSELLMLKNSTILSNTKTLLPFWYSIPIISSIIGLFRKKKPEEKIPEKKIVPEKKHSEHTKQLSKQEELSAAAKKLESLYIPEGSTIDRELNSYEKQWNKLITPEAHTQLTEDVNSLIYAYLRKVLHTISVSSFTVERIESLADTLVKTPNMQKISNLEALTVYVELYIIRLLGNV